MSNPGISPDAGLAPHQENTTRLFGLDDKPSNTVSLVAGFQHFLAVFGGIITAPLIMAKGMGLSISDTSYLITSALLISGFATLIQIARVGPFGSGLLSIQGTSFTFIGPILFAFFSLPESMSDHDKLAAIFGSSAICAIIMLPLCYYIHHLKKIFTPNVTGTTVILIGLTLVWKTLSNIYGQYSAAQEASDGWMIISMSAAVFVVTLLIAFSKNLWLRLASITAGLSVGFVIALAFKQVDFSVMDQLDTIFIPEPFKYGMSFNLGVLLLMLPVFFVTATESVGDLTATCSLSRLKTTGDVYWKRVKGGLLGDALNSLIAVCFATFPNTTFSQNNGVIRLTGIASRKVGYVVAGILVFMGLFPIVGGFFQMIPSAVVYGSTILMFGLVSVSGFSIVKRSGLTVRSIIIVSVSLIVGVLLSRYAGVISFLSDELKMFLAFPVSTGAFSAIALELLVPKEADEL